MEKTLQIIINLEVKGKLDKPEKIKESVYEYLKELIEDDSLDYEVKTL